MDLYAMPESFSLQQLPALSQQLQPQQQQIGADKLEEDSRIKAFVDASATDWQRQTQESVWAGKTSGRGQERGSTTRFYGRNFGPEKKVPPPGYICHRCGIAGHFIQHCPTNGDPAFDVKRMRPPTGIPKSMLVANPDGSYALPSGTVGTLGPDEAVFKQEVEGLTSSKTLAHIPFELHCPLCKNVLKDAMLASKCCFQSYCDKCIRDRILSNRKCACGATNILADDLLPNKTLRDAITSLLQTSSATGSAERPGSLHMMQASGSQSMKIRSSSPSGSGSGSQNIGSAAIAPLTAGKASLTQEKQQHSLVISFTGKRPESKEQSAESVSRQGPGSRNVLGSQKNLVVEEVQQEPICDAAGGRRRPEPKQKSPNGEEDGYDRNTGFYEGGTLPYPIDPALSGGFWPGPQYALDSFRRPTLNPQYQMLGDYNIITRERFKARESELMRQKEYEQKFQKTDRSKISGSEVRGSSELKSRTANVSRTASRPTYDGNPKGEKLCRQRTGYTSPSPQPMKRKRYERRDETSLQHLEDKMGFEANERPEKRLEATVFSEIRFPTNFNDRLPKLVESEKSSENEDEGASSISSRSKGRRMALTTQDSYKRNVARKSVVNNGHLRLTSRGASKSRLDDQSGDAHDDAGKRNFKHKAMHVSSSRDVPDRNVKNRRRR
ncbi:hypothetical protein KP509_39G057400 [Ceratopteris richardii]|nr:hypothetical protein KP509_39G057400 [Ceratopteris richardii]